MLYNGKIKLDGLTEIAGFTFHSHLRQTYRSHKVSTWAQKYKLGSWACLLSSFSTDTDSAWRQVFSSLQEPNPFQQESKWTQSCDSLWQIIGSKVLFCRVSENCATTESCLALNVSSCSFWIRWIWANKKPAGEQVLPVGIQMPYGMKTEVCPTPLNYLSVTLRGHFLCQKIFSLVGNWQIEIRFGTPIKNGI